MDHVFIRAEQPDDRMKIAEVLVRAFNRFDESNLVNRLHASKFFIPQFSLVLEKDENIVGYILLHPIFLVNEEEEEFTCLSLAPLAVLPQQHGKGYGTMLIQEAIARAKESTYPLIIVLGLPQVYTKCGFKTASKYGIKSPFDVPDEYFMVYQLHKNDISGTAVYPEVMF
ncbi:Acetyltransferase (GNAT) domain-containing protein [Brevinema andersonii]|uniref:Acetyltransferase (GNAT) domain-containing protein n=1 Tax=Brevinema andersonii TaxID=34097 RepID=A0A1I1E4R0_BREAD|nr:N-acetyltransferase [Brevinema andersonii]SFB82151.1 Acetyltransferase (GNAT) domain-containing protein [Brevinema andersonii]